jgi:hypothetical protein
MLQIEAVTLPKTLESLYETTLRDVPGDLSPDQHSCLNLVSYVGCICVCRCDLANRRDALCATLHQSWSPPDHGNHIAPLNAVTRVVHCRT